MIDDLGDRMKAYERLSEKRMMPLLPTFARVDGRSFHTFTKGLGRPFDPRFAAIMLNTAIALAKETNACMTYTQSDEITLCWYYETRNSSIWFDGKHSKMVSQAAALATIYFNTECQKYLPEYTHKLPTFDARVWQVPTLTEGSNVFMWREWDATKNSISMAAHSVYSDAQLHGKNGSDKQDMLMAKGINWNNYPTYFKRGVYIQRMLVDCKFSVEELDKLPPKHQARTNPDLTITRSVWNTVAMPPLSKVVNRNEVIFHGAKPRTEFA